jgi:hypothetical protein
MQELKHPEAALAFCRQAALLEPNVAGSYRDALTYAAKANDKDGMDWAAGRLLSHDWPTDNNKLHEDAEGRLREMATALTASQQTGAADQLLARLQDTRRRDLEITLLWQNDATPADLELLVEEPTGSLCSWRNRQTVGGGLLLGGAIGEKKETYIAAESFTGTYRVRVERMFGHPLGDKAQLRIVRHKGTPQEHEEIVTVAVPRGVSDTTKDPLLVKLDGGRRTHVAEVPTLAAAERLSTAVRPTTSTDAVSQLQRLADPSGNYDPDGATYGVGGMGYAPLGNAPERSPRDNLAHQTRVAPLTEGSVDLTAQAVVSADGRYVRLSMAPTFNLLTGKQLQPVVIRNPLIPGSAP